MGSFLILLGAAVVAIFLDSREVKACSCQPLHPQDLFCRSDFVIKALVNTGRLVELYPDGTFRRLNKNDKDEEEEDDETSGSFEGPEEVGPEIVALPMVEEVEIARPAPLMNHPRGPKGPNSRMPGYNSAPSGIRRRSRLVVHPPGYAGEVRHKRAATHRSLRRRRRRPLRAVAPGRLSEHSNMPMTRLMLQYRINIIKVFKGLENFTKPQVDFVYTPPPPLCSVRLPAGHSPFILMGDVQDGSLVVTLCDYKVDMMKLTGEERSNVVRNMEHRYPKECSRCHVRVCNRGRCDEEEPFTCTWKEWWSANSPWSSQFACIHSKKGECKWYYPLPEDVNPDDIDERSR